MPIWHLKFESRRTQYLPYAFTEQGVAMLSGVLRTKQAVQVNVAIMRAFVRLRETLALHKELATKLADLKWESDPANRAAMGVRRHADEGFGTREDHKKMRKAERSDFWKRLRE